MPDITIVKLKIRRGTNAQRQSVILEQGELGYTTDYKRVFIGDGVSSGGNIVGNINWVGQPRGLISYPVIGDTVYENNRLYQYTNIGWVDIGPQVDNASLTLSGSNNILAIKDQGITGSKFASSAAINGLTVTPGSGIGANVDSSSIKINNSNQLTVSAITQNNIVSSALGKGLQGGGGTVISVNADTNTFGFNGSTLALTAIPPGIITATALSSTFAGNGLTVTGGRLNARLADNLTIRDDGTTLSLASIGGSTSNTTWNTVNFDSYGRYSTKSTSIMDVLCASNTNPYLSAFNGYPGQSTRTNQTLINTVSTNPGGTTIVKVLTSAGFITFASGAFSVNGTTIGSFAIPIYSY